MNSKQRESYQFSIIISINHHINSPPIMLTSQQAKAQLCSAVLCWSPMPCLLLWWWLGVDLEPHKPLFSPHAHKRHTRLKEKVMSPQKTSHSPVMASEPVAAALRGYIPFCKPVFQEQKSGLWSWRLSSPTDCPHLGTAVLIRPGPAQDPSGTIWWQEHQWGCVAAPWALLCCLGWDPPGAPHVPHHASLGARWALPGYGCSKLGLPWQTPFST